MGNTQRPELSTDEKKELFLLVFANESGHISNACRLVGIHRRTYYLWLSDDEEFAQNIEDIQGADTDEIIHSMIVLAKSGDRAMVKYYLDHKGKQAGFGKRVSDNTALPAGNNALHLHYHAPPEPKSLVDWEKQVRDARNKRQLEMVNVTPVDEEGA